MAELAMVGLLADIGKVNVPQALLDKINAAIAAIRATSASSTSRVVPAMGVTMAASRAVRALNSDDLPALVSPIRTMR